VTSSPRAPQPRGPEHKPSQTSGEELIRIDAPMSSKASSGPPMTWSTSVARGETSLPRAAARAHTARARAPMCRPKIHDYVRFEIYFARRTRRRACPRGYSLVRAASVQSSPREAR
jgi:hypothetical protein